MNNDPTLPSLSSIDACIYHRSNRIKSKVKNPRIYRRATEVLATQLRSSGTQQFDSGRDKQCQKTFQHGPPCISLQYSRRRRICGSHRQAVGTSFTCIPPGHLVIPATAPKAQGVNQGSLGKTFLKSVISANSWVNLLWYLALKRRQN